MQAGAMNTVADLDDHDVKMLFVFKLKADTQRLNA